MEGVDAIRSRLQSAFDNMSEDGILQTTGDFEFLGAPKEFEKGMKVLWTAQMEALYGELREEEVKQSVFGLIMSGPSGIGKSCIAHTIANRLFAEGRSVVYVPDMKVFLLKALRVAGQQAATNTQGLQQIPMDLRLDHCVALQLRSLLLRQSADKFEANEVLRSEFLTGSEVMNFFHDKKVVFIVDEHGHGFRYLKENGYCVENACHFLLPECYLGNGNARFLFGGSNQALFELALNESYKNLLRFMLPFSDPEAAKFVEHVLEDRKYSQDQYKVFANNVPRQMILLSRYANTKAYLTTQHKNMYNDLTSKLAEELANRDLLETLAGLFNLSSDGYSFPVSFLDLGYVYRKHSEKGLLAHPLCYPAALALLDLWNKLSSEQGGVKDRLELVRNDGASFEKYQREVFISRAFGSTPLTIKCRRLGCLQYEPAQLVPFKADAYMISEVENPNGTGDSAFQNEVASLKMRATEHNLSILYKCPDGSDTVDFILFRPNGKQSVVQASISEFARHPSPDLEFLGRGRKKKSLRLDLDHFLFVTVKPKPHPNIAEESKNDTSSKWFGCHDVVRIVDAAENFGF